MVIRWFQMWMLKLWPSRGDEKVVGTDLRWHLGHMLGVGAKKDKQNRPAESILIGHGDNFPKSHLFSRVFLYAFPALRSAHNPMQD